MAGEERRGFGRGKSGVVLYEARANLPEGVKRRAIKPVSGRRIVTFKTVENACIMKDAICRAKQWHRKARSDDVSSRGGGGDISQLLKQLKRRKAVNGVLTGCATGSDGRRRGCVKNNGQSSRVRMRIVW